MKESCEGKKGGGCRAKGGIWSGGGRSFSTNRSGRKLLGTTPTPKTEKTAPKKRVRAKKDEVLTDQPDFDPPESDGKETCWEEDSEEEEVREEDQIVEEKKPRNVLVG